MLPVLTRSPLQFMMLLAIRATEYPDQGLMGVHVWNSPAGKEQRHELYKAGLILQDRRTGCYSLTEKGEAMVEAILDTPEPVKQEVVTTVWHIPQAA